MWAWRGLLCVSLVCGLALDSNTIRSSKEASSTENMDRSHGDRRQTETMFNSQQRPCSMADCSTPMRNACSNRAQRRTAPVDRQVHPQGDRQVHPQGDRQVHPQGDRQVHPQGDTQVHPQGDRERLAGGHFNRTKAPEMASCVRSGDCAAGLCCVRYLTGKRCQRIPVEGDVCLLRGSTKRRRNLGRCDCATGLICGAGGRAELGQVKGQGVCLPHQRQRKTRHSGKKRGTAERSC